MVDDLAHGTQAVTFVTALVGVGIWIGWARRYRRMWLYSVAPISWLLHTAIYYAVYFLLGAQLTPGLVFWGAVARMHGAFLVLGIGSGLYWERVHLKHPGGP